MIKELSRRLKTCDMKKQDIELVLGEFQNKTKHFPDVDLDDSVIHELILGILSECNYEKPAKKYKSLYRGKTPDHPSMVHHIH